ncbi:hypothetical protein VUR80DRAFT_5031 [Thermomyces stellatus]
MNERESEQVGAGGAGGGRRDGLAAVDPLALGPTPLNPRRCTQVPLRTWPDEGKAGVTGQGSPGRGTSGPYRCIPPRLSMQSPGPCSLATLSHGKSASRQATEWLWFAARLQSTGNLTKPAGKPSFQAVAFPMGCGCSWCLGALERNGPASRINTAIRWHRHLSARTRSRRGSGRLAGEGGQD